MEEESDVVPNECGRTVDDGIDRISELPDEILCVILSFLRLREAAATSVLSSRWLDLWKHTRNLCFYESSLTLDYDNPDDKGLFEAKRCKCIETVNSIIQSHRAPWLKIFGIYLYVKESDKCAVTKWLNFVLSRKVERFELNFKKYSDLPLFDEWLREESIICRAPETQQFFQSLKSLRLTWLKLSGEEIELFIRNCPLLERLFLIGVHMTSDAFLCGENLMLKDLVIDYTKGQDSIKISAPNLTRIRFSNAAWTLSFENVSKLVSAYFNLVGKLFPVQHFASAASCYLSQLQSLKLLIHHPKELWTSGFLELPNLKKLVIIGYEVYNHSLLPVTALIWASPRLKEIKIKFTGFLRDTSAWMGAMTNVERSPHQHLKVFAFQMSCCQYFDISHDRTVELVTYILENCAALQKIIIGSPLYEYDKPADRITAEMQADADDLTQQLQAKVPHHIQLELPISIEEGDMFT